VYEEVATWNFLVRSAKAIRGMIGLDEEVEIGISGAAPIPASSRMVPVPSAFH
jgi:hypothetical protein